VSAHAGALVRATTGPPPSTQRLFDACDISAIATETGLALAPGVSAAKLAAMLDRAFRTADHRRQVRAQGDARKAWLRALENDLVQIYRITFGRSPASGENHDNPVARWLRCLCRIGAARGAGWCSDQTFREIARLSDETMATYLRRAVTRQRRSPRP